MLKRRAALFFILLKLFKPLEIIVPFCVLNAWISHFNLRLKVGLQEKWYCFLKIYISTQKLSIIAAIPIMQNLERIKKFMEEIQTTKWPNSKIKSIEVFQVMTQEVITSQEWSKVQHYATTLQKRLHHNNVKINKKKKKKCKHFSNT